MNEDILELERILEDKFRKDNYAEEHYYSFGSFVQIKPRDYYVGLISGYLDNVSIKVIKLLYYLDNIELVMHSNDDVFQGLLYKNMSIWINQDA